MPHALHQTHCQMYNAYKIDKTTKCPGLIDFRCPVFKLSPQQLSLTTQYILNHICPQNHMCFYHQLKTHPKHCRFVSIYFSFASHRVLHLSHCFTQTRILNFLFKKIMLIYIMTTKSLQGIIIIIIFIS